MLSILQEALGIHPPAEEPIFPAGSDASRQATLSISSSMGDKPRAWIDTYFPILNYPVDSAVQILDENGDPVWSADLFERTDSGEDADAVRFAGEVPAFHGYSRDGDVRGRLVFANFGRIEDYDNLKRDGVFVVNFA
jgi:N-acetylated-alpha-linked acidic dipeptidase